MQIRLNIDGHLVTGVVLRCVVLAFFASFLWLVCSLGLGWSVSWSDWFFSNALLIVLFSDLWRLWQPMKLRLAGEGKRDRRLADAVFIMYCVLVGNSWVKFWAALSHKAWIRNGGMEAGFVFVVTALAFIWLRRSLLRRIDLVPA
jgi:hypothetical protein